MGINKNTIQYCYQKYNGYCAYTGYPLIEGFQIDHIHPKCSVIWHQPEETKIKLGFFIKNVDDIENLVAVNSIINHYKRGLNLEQFREYMMGFHLRLAKLPKKTKLVKTEKRIIYMKRVAQLFGITIDKPFCGKFYFEIVAEKGKNTFIKNISNEK